MNSKFENGEFSESTMKVSPGTTANRPSCVDQERTSLSKRIVFIVTQLNGLDALNIKDLTIPDSARYTAPCQTVNTAIR